uniref:Uncharacterized protein n=1 Tax=Panagrolaimus davidi TaxID=227884 RepID=A0A914PPF7_9BILA
MPSLFPEILLEISKKFLEDGNSDAITKFALSGKQQLNAMKEIFVSVETLELYSDYYIIKWDHQTSVKHDPNYNKISKLFMHCIGDSVTNLHINDYFSNVDHKVYQPIFDKINEKLQLVTFSISPDACCSSEFLAAFLTMFDTTLKNVSIPKEVKQLIIDSKDCNVPNRTNFEELMKYFPSLELIKFISSSSYPISVPKHIQSYIKIISEVYKIPPTIVIRFHALNKYMGLLKLEACKKSCGDLVIEKSNDDCFCFCKIVQSGDSQSTILM